MDDKQLFAGVFYNYLKTKPPLNQAEYFTQGSSAMLFQRDGKLFRLTLDACGHDFLASQSSQGNPNVVKIIHDYGPVAPSDDCPADDYYWLAQVEWLQDLDPADATTQRLNALFVELTDDEPLVMEPDLPALIERCQRMAEQHPEFAALLHTLAEAARTGSDADVQISNIMRRPATGQLVWSDPLYGTSSYLDPEQQRRMDALREQLTPIR
jgi:hypothetical protein